MCTKCTLYSSTVLICCCFYLYTVLVHIKECTFDIFNKTFLQVKQKKSKCRNTRTNSFFLIKSQRKRGGGVNELIITLT